LDELENVLLGRKHSSVLTGCSTVEVYYISSMLSVISTNEVINVAQALSKQISNSKILSNHPHPMDLCARLVNSFIPDVFGHSVSHTPNINGQIWETSTYQPASAFKKLELD
jgi:hypothetical protein